MTDCCQDKECEVAALRESHGKVLWAVLAINAIMFVVEGYAGIVAHSTSLLADGQDLRPVTVDEGTNTVVGVDPARIVAAADAVLAGHGKMGRRPQLWDGRAAERIVEALRARLFTAG